MSVNGMFGWVSLTAFVQDESGQDQMEYALIASLLSLLAVASVKTLAESVLTAWTRVGTEMGAAV